MYLGKRIKELRENRQMSLTQLAQTSGVQIATLSRIENQKMTGSLESHMSIARALGIELPQLYQDITTKESAPAADFPQTETFSYNEKASYEILTNNVLKKKMMPIVLRIEPGGRTNAEKNAQGSEKFIFVLEGSVTTHVGPQSFPIQENNTLYFDSSVEHYFENSGNATVKVIVVGTPVAL